MALPGHRPSVLKPQISFHVFKITGRLIFCQGFFCIPPGIRIPAHSSAFHFRACILSAFQSHSFPLFIFFLHSRSCTNIPFFSIWPAVSHFAFFAFHFTFVGRFAFQSHIPQIFVAIFIFVFLHQYSIWLHSVRDMPFCIPRIPSAHSSHRSGRFFIPKNQIVTIRRRFAFHPHIPEIFRRLFTFGLMHSYSIWAHSGCCMPFCIFCIPP